MNKTKEGYLSEQFIYCGCGCGKTRSRFDKLKRERQFINNHQNIIYKNIGVKMHKNGYRMILKPEHRLANSQGWILEHRLIWEEFHKASLLKWSHVHHINEIEDDNRPENLQGMTRQRHRGLHNKQNKYGKIDMSKRKCFLCLSSKTSSQNGRQKWYRYNSKFICNKCYKRQQP